MEQVTKCEVCGVKTDDGWNFCAIEGHLGRPKQEAGFVCGRCLEQFADAAGIDRAAFWTAFCAERLRRQARLALDTGRSEPRSLYEVFSESQSAGEETGRVPQF